METLPGEKLQTHGQWRLDLKVAGSLREAGEERAGSGIIKVAGTGRNRKKNTNWRETTDGRESGETGNISHHCVIFCNRKSTMGGVLKKVLYGEALPRGPTPYLLYTIFD